jgi:hypothetical protein
MSNAPTGQAPPGLDLSADGLQWKIHIHLPRDRARPGELLLFNSSKAAPVFSCPCLGKADNQQAAIRGNPDRSAIRPYGDTPTGSYVPTRVEPYRGIGKHIGPRWMPLEGADGEALQARVNGRTGLAIHAGRGDGRLVPTHGCIRVRDADFAAIDRFLNGAVVEVTVFEVGEVPR